MITVLLLVRATYIYGVVLHAHPVRGQSRIQRNTTGEVATMILNNSVNVRLFYQKHVERNGSHAFSQSKSKFLFSLGLNLFYITALQAKVAQHLPSCLMSLERLKSATRRPATANTPCTSALASHQ